MVKRKADKAAQAGAATQRKAKAAAPEGASAKRKAEAVAPEGAATRKKPAAAAPEGKAQAALIGRAHGLLEGADYKGAAAAAKEALGDLDLKALSVAAVVRGKALLAPLIKRLATGKKKNAPQTDHEFREPWELFEKAMRLDPKNKEAKEEFQTLNSFLMEQFGGKPKAARAGARHNHKEPLDVIVVGAGASGVGVALLLTKTFELDPDRVLLLERGEGVGETFRRWPREMRFISPSFNHQGWTRSFDLNSVAYGTSPAFTLHAEHPSGEQYARYLRVLAEEGELRVRARTEVMAVRPTRRGGFDVDVVPTGTADGAQPETLRSRYVVWAAGEFQSPGASASEPPPFPGAELCRHNSTVRSWAELPGDDFVVIGGYESGMDATFNLASKGKRCTVVSATGYWDVATDDPSTELAPYTADRVREACAKAVPPRLLAPLRVFAVEQCDASAGGGYLVHARWGPPQEKTDEMGKHREPLPAAAAKDSKAAVSASKEGEELTLRTPQPPLLCTGFGGGVALGVVKDLFEWGEPPELDGEDEDEESEEEEEEEEEEEGEEEEEEEDDGEDDGEGKAEDEKDKSEKRKGESDEGEKGEKSEKNEKSEEGKEGGGGCAEGSPLLNPYDESTKTPGLFLVGPAVRHAKMSFCFVYKFRQRFGIVANAIAEGLGYDTEEPVEECRNMNMFLDDFSCCQAACGETCSK